MAHALTRRNFLAASASAALPVSAPAIAQPAPFKIGLLTVKTGPLAQGGIQMEQGIQTFLRQKQNTLAGRKIEFVSADTGGNPAGAKTKAQELIERERVNVILGPLAAFELLAITDYIRQTETPLISVAAAEDVTQRNVNPFVLRPSGTSAQSMHALADYAAKELKYKTAATISEDFAFGYEQMAGFQRVFEDNGGKVVLKLWPPLVTPDYTPYIAQIQDVDCCVHGFAGSNPVKFMRAYNDLGIKARIPLLAGGTAMDDALLNSLGDEALGVISACWYSADFDSPTNKRFVADMQKDYNAIPGLYSAAMYIGGQCVEAALQRLGADAGDKKAFAAALHQVSLADSPAGAMHFDEYGNVVTSIYIRRCESRGGKRVNTVIKTYPDVSQFWTYEPKWFLSQPVYSRNFPPARHLRQ